MVDSFILARRREERRQDQSWLVSDGVVEIGLDDHLLRFRENFVRCSETDEWHPENDEIRGEIEEHFELARRSVGYTQRLSNVDADQRKIEDDERSGTGEQLNRHATMSTPLYTLMETKFLSDQTNDEEKVEQSDQQGGKITIHKSIEHGQSPIAVGTGTRTDVLIVIDRLFTGQEEDENGVENARIQCDTGQGKIMHEKPLFRRIQPMTMENQNVSFDRGPSHQHA